jgi:dephospho-CoA kinase
VAHKPTIVGLLGGIASGKSTVARLFAEAGAAVLDADRLAHDCLARPDVTSEVVRRFGRGVLAEESGERIDRARLAQLAFADDANRRALEAIVHPCVGRAIAERLAALATEGRVRVAILDVPLLLESELNRLCDVRIFVDAPLALREARAQQARGWAPGELARREKFQKPTEYKRGAADYIIVNEGSLEPLRSRIREILDDLKQTAP